MSQFTPGSSPTQALIHYFIALEMMSGHSILLILGLELMGGWWVNVGIEDVENQCHNLLTPGNEDSHQ